MKTTQKRMPATNRRQKEGMAAISEYVSENATQRNDIEQ